MPKIVDCFADRITEIQDLQRSADGMKENWPKKAGQAIEEILTKENALIVEFQAQESEFYEQLRDRTRRTREILETIRTTA